MFAGNAMLHAQVGDAEPGSLQQGLPQRTPALRRTIHDHHHRPRRPANRVDAQPEMVGHPAAAGRRSPTPCSTTPRRFPALQNNALDAVGLTTLDELKIAQGTAGHRDPTGTRAHLVSLHLQRRRGVDPGRSGAADRRSPRASTARPSPAITQHGLTDNPVPLNNHIYLAGQEGYQDNSSRVRSRGGQARTRRVGLASQRSVPRERRRASSPSAMSSTTLRAPARSARSRRTTWRRSGST